MIGRGLVRNTIVSFAFFSLGYKFVSLCDNYIYVDKDDVTYKFSIQDDGTVKLLDSDNSDIDDEFVKLTKAFERRL